MLRAAAFGENARIQGRLLDLAKYQTPPVRILQMRAGKIRTSMIKSTIQ
jgi:hypothetical protein